mgnify:FL=1
MNLSRRLTKLSLDLIMGSFSGIAIELILEILSAIFGLTFLVIFWLFMLDLGGGAPDTTKEQVITFCLYYSPILLIKIAVCSGFFIGLKEIKPPYLGTAYMIVTKFIGIYTLFYWTLFEIWAYATQWQWISTQTSSLLEYCLIVPPPFYTLLLWANLESEFHNFLFDLTFSSIPISIFFFIA